MSLAKKFRKLFSVTPAPEERPYADADTLGKAERFEERFREVVSDPVNLLIARVPAAGYVDRSGKVILHNGIRVPIRGPGSYYGTFSDLLVINRGVHEPLEEYCFQEMLANLASPKPVMLELGAYWAHYSMWLKQTHPQAVCHMVEPDPANLEAGRENFRANGFTGEFHQGLVGRGGFQVDAFLRTHGFDHLDILHADIQGFEAEMLEGAAEALSAHRVDRVFVSTHSEALHVSVEATLRSHGYQVEISSPPEGHTTSFDGFILASAPGLQLVLGGWQALGRLEILRADPARLLRSVAGRVGGPA